MAAKPLSIVAACVLAVGLPAVAQQMAQTQPPPAANRYPNGGIGATQPQQPPEASSAAAADNSAGADETAVEEVSPANLQPAQAVRPPVEYPGWARRLSLIHI